MRSSLDNMVNPPGPDTGNDLAGFAARITEKRRVASTSARPAWIDDQIHVLHRDCPEQHFVAQHERTHHADAVFASHQNGTDVGHADTGTIRQSGFAHLQRLEPVSASAGTSIGSIDGFCVIVGCSALCAWTLRSNAGSVQTMSPTMLRC
jgi:hypothetical protein